MASTVNAIYTYPEWNVEWMKEENTVEKSKTPEDRKANEWALEYWDKWALQAAGATRSSSRSTASIPDPVYKAGLIAEFMSWPGGGGNLNYPRVYNEGLASIIKDVEERQKALDMRLPNASKFYFYEACLITMRAVIRLAHRYAELAREMAAKEKDADPQAGADRHRRDLRVGSRAPGPEPAGGHPVPLPLPHLRRDSSRSAAATPRPTWARTSSRSTSVTRRPA